jgi:hypothetical protein
MHHCWAIIENKNTPSTIIRVVLRIDKHGSQKESIMVYNHKSQIKK